MIYDSVHSIHKQHDLTESWGHTDRQRERERQAGRETFRFPMSNPEAPEETPLFRADSDFWVCWSGESETLCVSGCERLCTGAFQCVSLFTCEFCVRVCEWVFLWSQTDLLDQRTDPVEPKLRAPSSADLGACLRILAAPENSVSWNKCFGLWVLKLNRCLWVTCLRAVSRFSLESLSEIVSFKL